MGGGGESLQGSTSLTEARSSFGHGQLLLCGHETHLDGAHPGEVKVKMPASVSTRAEETGGEEDMEEYDSHWHRRRVT